MQNKYLQISREDIPKEIIVKRTGRKFELRFGRARPIPIGLPFILNEKIARICGMMLDGCLYKNLSLCSFSQKKDATKIDEFESIIKDKFSVSMKKYMVRDTPELRASSKTLCAFLYHCVDMHKSDEDARIPWWIWNSPPSVVKDYIRYAFAMEASVIDPKIGAKEVKFHSCDESYLKALQYLLKKRFGIKTFLGAYFVKSYGSKYYLSIFGRSSLTKFADIGIALESHQKRLDAVIKSYKPKAWEITLVNVLKVNKHHFSVKDIHKFFPYICKRAVHNRMTDLVKFEYLELNGEYSLTTSGKDKAISLKDKIKTVKLRTHPKENEQRVLEFLHQKENYTNQIARELQLHSATVRDTLYRLEGKGEIKLNRMDHFQRKFWTVAP